MCPPFELGSKSTWRSSPSNRVGRHGTVFEAFGGSGSICAYDAEPFWRRERNITRAAMRQAVPSDGLSLAEHPDPPPAMDTQSGGALDLDTRMWFFSNYYSVSSGMLSQIPGKGALYVIASNDSEGVPLRGGSNYRVNLPKDVPAANFWSITVYETDNASGLANGQALPSLGSRDKPIQDADGSTDLYFGPKPLRRKERNRIATVPGRGVLRDPAAIRPDGAGP